MLKYVNRNNRFLQQVRDFKFNGKLTIRKQPPGL